MKANTTLTLLILGLTFTLYACSKHSDSSDHNETYDKERNFLQTGFTINYLIRNPWYGVATDEAQARCLSKFTFSENKIVSTTYFNNDDGSTLESEDLLYSVISDTSLTIDDLDVFYYRSHSKQQIITDEAHFFKNYSDAIDFAGSINLNCRASFPE